jgi:hypothetical protein
MPSTESNAFLSIENRAWRSESRHQHQQDHQRQPDRQRKEDARDVESRFPAGDLLHRRVLKIDCRPTRFRAVPVRTVIGQAAALGRPPQMREMAFYPHLLISSNRC